MDVIAAAENTGLSMSIAQLIGVRQALAVYKEFGADTPEILVEKEKALTNQIKGMVRDQKARKIRMLKGRLEALKTDSEKRADLQAELAKLEEESK